MNPKLLERGVILTFHKEPGTHEYLAKLRFNTTSEGDGLTVMGWGFGSITRALGNAVKKATGILQLPGINLLIPPPFSTAVQLAHHLASLAAKGDLGKLIKDPISGLMVPLFSQIKNPLIRKLAEHMAKVPMAALHMQGHGHHHHHHRHHHRVSGSIMGSENAINLLGCVSGLEGLEGDMGEGVDGDMGWRGGRGGWRPRGGGYGGVEFVDPYAIPVAPAFALPHPQLTFVRGDMGDGAGVMGAPPYPVPSYGPDFAAGYAGVYGPQGGGLKIDRWPL